MSQPPILAPDGSPAFNARLHAELQAIANAAGEALGSNLAALILGGGYGRGEGGVVTVDGEERPYNDLDFTVVVRQKQPELQPSLRQAGEHFAARLGIEVDFSRPLTVADIRAWPHCMMWHDLYHGHLVLAGPADVLAANAPARVASPLPAVEATRLLLNRGAGLLWAMRVAHGVEPAPDADFVRRNYQKCALALGDALLVLAGRYTPRYAGRDELLAQAGPAAAPAESAAVLPLYRDALRFKFRPDTVPALDDPQAGLSLLAGLWERVFLRVESTRFGREWSRADYCAWAGVREQEQHRAGRLPRNLALNLKGRRLSWRYPREALYRQLPELLAAGSAPPAGWADSSSCFLEQWKRFN